MRKGIVLAGGSGTRLYPLTQVVSKQLMPVYDKPMIYYPISTLMQAGIKEILIIGTPSDLPRFQELLGSGKQWGLSFEYVEQAKPEGLVQAFTLAERFLEGAAAVMILGDNLFYGHSLVHQLRQASRQTQGARVFAYRVSNPEDYGVLELDDNQGILTIEEKPKEPKSNFVLTGIYFFDKDVVKYAKKITPSKRGELEITDLIELYLQKKELDVSFLGRGAVWLDTGTHERLLSAAQFIGTIEQRQGLKVNCPEEVAYRLGYIDQEQLIKLAAPLQKSGYGDYLLSIATE